MKRVLIKLIPVGLMWAVLLFVFYSDNGMNILTYISGNPWVFVVFTIVIALVIPYGITYLLKRRKQKYISKIDTNNMNYDFEGLYDTLYAQCIEELEVLRKKVRIRTLIQYILYVILLIGYIFGKSKVVIIDRNIDDLIGIGGLLIGLISIPLTYFNYKYTKKYKETYKQKIISNFVKLVDTNLVLAQHVDQSLASNEYAKANFDNKRYNRFSVNDQLDGSVEKGTLKVWDLDIKKVTGSGKNRDTEDIFQGIFATVECNNNIGGNIKIGRNKQFKSDNKIELDSNDFEKYFDVYSTNKILALRILTHDIMAMLVDFYNKYNLHFEIVFDNNKLYLRFETVDMFEPKVFSSSIKKELLYTEYVILKLIIKLTKKVNDVQLNLE